MNDYSILDGTKEAIKLLLHYSGSEIPKEVLLHLEDVSFSTATDGHQIYFPCPFRETEAAAALKAVEASTVATIAGFLFGEKKRKIDVNLEKTAAFLFSTYITTIGGQAKQDPGVKAKLKDTDLRQAQSILYRRLSANLYETKNAGEYFHIHGSLDASTTLEMIGLEPHRPDLTDYRECLDTIEKHVKQFTAQELEEINAREKQAGVTALKWEEFKETNHGKSLLQLPPWTVKNLESNSPPAPFLPLREPIGKLPQILTGIRVLELCRIIAGPAIGRTLAEYGASVMKITSPHLPDVPFFQVDGNTGKHAVNLDLKTSQDRKIFEELLQTADVVLDGYRPGSLARLGYGPEQVVELTKGRGKGIVYVSEDCFGPGGEWSGRPGWQQIADCVSGIAWAQGKSMKLDEPVVPPFPMSDYGTGCMGAIAALTGLLRRATIGGSWIGRTSLVQYDIFLLRLGLYDEVVMDGMRKTHDKEFFELRHADSVDEVGKRALKSMKRTHPELFFEELIQKAWSTGFNEEIRWVKSAVAIEGIRVGFERASRPNGFDSPTWDDWEVDEELL